MKNFCIIANEYKDKDHHLTREMQKYIAEKGGRCDVIAQSGEIPKDAECIFVLGGDGTLIQAAGIASEKNIPMIGVNLGHLGYLCELEESNVYPAIDQIMQGNYITEERMMLNGYSVTAKEGVHLPETALNDIVICRKGALQLVELMVMVNGEYLNTFRADGIIVATPTGSTGYSMSAGGPIVDPKARMILITPINSHDLNAKSIVIGAEDEVTIELQSRQSQKDEKAEVNFDGQQVMELSVGDSITIQASQRKTKILKLSKISFLEILRKKMQLYS